jgi:hypothetical protein
LNEELNLDSVELQKIMANEEETRRLKNLFKNSVFFISREVPNEILGLAILSCGGVYGDESDNSSFKIVKIKTYFIFIFLGRSQNYSFHY